MSELALSRLSPDEARSLTDEVKQDAERLWRKLVELYDGRAHEVLGYGSWHSYCAVEFGFGKSRSYELKDAGAVVEVLGSEISELPSNDAQARELAPLLDQPETLRATWAEVVDLHPEPTAAHVREAVQRRLPEPTEEERERQLRWAATMNVLDGLQHFDREPVSDHAVREAALIDQQIAATRGETVTPERLRRASSWAAVLADALEETTDG